MRVTILGHASLFFEAAGERVLLDPVLRTTPLYGSLVHRYPRALDLDRMPRPTLIVVTHAHFDHFDPETLGALPKDVPVVVPPDKRMAKKLRAWGFRDLIPLDTWQHAEHGAFRLIATPSEAPVEEFGLVIESQGARLWHMSDAEPPKDAAAEILSQRGPIDVVTVKFQPADPQLNFQHNMGSSFDRRAVAGWLEIASACAPKLAFPYASGLSFSGQRAWLNRYAYPFSAEHVADLLRRRLFGIGVAAAPRPGDVITIEDRGVALEKQASTFVRQAEPEASIAWEPFDDARLLGLSGGEERDRFVEELDAVLLGSELASWLEKNTTGDKAPLVAFRQWRVDCQIVVHLGSGERACYRIDFSGETPRVNRGEALSANYFTHLSGEALRRLLAGAATPLEVMIEGSVNICDRIIALRDGRLEAPATPRLYEEFPDPILTFGGTRRPPAKHDERAG